ncbi:MAG: YebC/PmpR family DNA-binding transcriptional regulator [Planctomycetota bacterium]|nr:YebC/PmpR family DNA-binding transcriptional regulator [Planctomycetota bacterium]
MGRQWLQKHREINAAKRGKITGKLVREISIAAKGGADPSMNARLAVAVEAARKASVPNDTIKRAINKGAGIGGEKLELETVTFEGFAPHKVPVIVECLTDNRKRTAPEMRVLFRAGQLGAKVRFFFDHMGIIDATHATEGLDPEEAAIEAGAQDCEPLDETPEEGTGGRFYTDPTDLDTVTVALGEAGWTVTASDIGFRPKELMELEGEQRSDVESFLAALDDNDDVHRIYAALA